MTKQATLAAEGKREGFYYGYVIAGLAFLLMVVMWGPYYSFGIFFNPLLAEFGLTRAQVSGVFSLSFLLSGILGMGTGKLNDRFGPRVILSVLSVFLGLGYFLMSRVGAIWQLYLAYGIILAIGMSAGFVPLSSVVARWFKRSRGLMTGVVVSGVGAGTLIMPPVANWLITRYDWRTAFIIIGVVVFAGTLIGAQFLRREPDQLPSSQNMGKKSARAEVHALSLPAAVRTPQLWLLGISFMGFGLFLQTILIHIVPHMTDLAISTTTAASILAAIGGISISGRILIGIFADRFGTRLSLIICYATVAASVVWLLFSHQAWDFLLFAAVFGFSYGGLTSLESTSVADFFGLSSHGAILGVIAFSITFGSALGPVLGGYIFDITGRYQAAFLLCLAFSIIGMALSIALRPLGKQVHEDVKN